jgi:putative ABC transport system permease protein
VIGVLQDFVFNLSARATGPLIVYLGRNNLDHFLVRLNNDGHWKDNLAGIGKVARSLNPGYPFTFRFTDDEHQDQFRKDFGLEQLANIFSVMAILISCMGLFGLATFLVERRTREIGIRKVLGASPTGLWASLSAEMLKPVLLGFILAAPLAALTASALLRIQEYHTHLTWWIFALPGLGALAIALGTVTWQGLQAANINPANVLKQE